MENTGNFSDLPDNLSIKLEKIKTIFSGQKIVIALSGGVDSSLLLYLANKFGEKVFPGFIKGQHMSSRELSHAEKISRSLDLNLKIFVLKFPNDHPFLKNPITRCYLCKKEIIRILESYKDQIQADIVVEGTHSSDSSAYRPGKKALHESMVISPYLQADFTKHEIVELAEFIKFPPKILPSNSCLATRVPYHISLKSDLLDLVEQSENFINQKMGNELFPLRVRVLLTDQNSYLARIESNQDFINFIQNESNREIIYQKLKDLGFSFVTVDLEGYRSSSFASKGAVSYRDFSS